MLTRKGSPKALDVLEVVDLPVREPDGQGVRSQLTGTPLTGSRAKPPSHKADDPFPDQEDDEAQYEHALAFQGIARGEG